MSRESSKHSDVTLVSWNVKGMNTPLKRGKVYVHLRTLKADICFLQETHIKKGIKNIMSFLGIKFSNQISVQKQEE